MRFYVARRGLTSLNTYNVKSKNVIHCTFVYIQVNWDHSFSGKKKINWNRLYKLFDYRDVTTLALSIGFKF